MTDRNTSVCTVCGAYAHRSCEWDGDDPPCERRDTFEEEPDADDMDMSDYALEDRIERSLIEKEIGR